MKLVHIKEIVRALPIYIHLLFYVFTGYSFRHLSIYRVYSQLHILEVFRSCSNVYIIIHCPFVLPFSQEEKVVLLYFTNKNVTPKIPSQNHCKQHGVGLYFLSKNLINLLINFGLKII